MTAPNRRSDSGLNRLPLPTDNDPPLYWFIVQPDEGPDMQFIGLLVGEISIDSIPWFSSRDGRWSGTVRVTLLRPESGGYVLVRESREVASCFITTSATEGATPQETLRKLGHNALTHMLFSSLGIDTGVPVRLDTGDEFWGPPAGLLDPSTGGQP